ncbi:methyltransferase domain-containing protein [Hyphomicrobium sp. MC8b]|uniref:methyltransferase domain-containing protein n=1 Tax=Hyphomicrobium sp. MC8b TaxID=300273 RepID=UPI0039188451
MQNNISGPRGLAETDGLAQQILFSCGGPKVLVVDSEPCALVSALLSKCVDAHGTTFVRSIAEAAELNIPDRIKFATSSELPFESTSFDTVVVTLSFERDDEKTISLLREVKRVTRRAIFLRILRDPNNPSSEPDFPVREWVERHAFSVGLRKHPSYYFVNGYESIKSFDNIIHILLEPVPADALAEYPIHALAEERDLHMDMLREAGARSDAHVCRYQWAVPYVRPGDTVLDAACGLGYGSYVIQTNTKARRTIGIDNSAYAIAYASKNFSTVSPELEFRKGDLPDSLREIPSNSVDVVTSFETLEHIAENHVLLAEFQRILTPAGRILVSIPNDWTDEGGNDPNPYHVHVYTLERLRDELSRLFTLENVTAQSASRHKSGVGSSTWLAAGRRFESIPLDIEEKSAPLAEWWLAVGMKSPLEGRSVPFRETQYPMFEDERWHVTAFGRDYDNPWLVRGMVDVTHRLKNSAALRELALKTIETSRPNSPDTGAALANIGYRLLESAPDLKYADVNIFIGQVASYVENEMDAPHSLRWKISLYFLCGKLWVAVGNFENAIDSFTKCVALDPFAFSPLLANRTVEARLHLGMLCLAAEDPNAAADHWRRGINQALQAVSTNLTASIGNPDTPAEFALPELASILEYASSCAYALNGISDAKIRPLWWFERYRDRLSQRKMIDTEASTIKAERITCLQQLADLNAKLAAHVSPFATQLNDQFDFKRQVQRNLPEKTNKQRTTYRTYLKEALEKTTLLAAPIMTKLRGDI